MGPGEGGRILLPSPFPFGCGRVAAGGVPAGGGGAGDGNALGMLQAWGPPGIPEVDPQPERVPAAAGCPSPAGFWGAAGPWPCFGGNPPRRKATKASAKSPPHPSPGLRFGPLPVTSPPRAASGCPPRSTPGAARVGGDAHPCPAQPGPPPRRGRG